MPCYIEVTTTLNRQGWIHMTQNHDNTVSRKGKHLTYSERCQIAILKKENYSNRQVAQPGQPIFWIRFLNTIIRPFQSAPFLSAQIVALQRRNCMTSVKKKSISTSFGSNGMPAYISSRNSLFKLGMRPNGVRRKSISTPFATKPALGSMIVGFAFVLSGKQMNWFSTMNSLSPIYPMLSRLNKSTKRIGREVRWRISSRKPRMASSSTRRTVLISWRMPSAWWSASFPITSTILYAH